MCVEAPLVLCDVLADTGVLLSLWLLKLVLLVLLGAGEGAGLHSAANASSLGGWKTSGRAVHV